MSQSFSKQEGTQKLLTEVQRRAFRFFWEQSDPHTGITKDRASNTGSLKHYTVGSIASTGYALASLPVAVEHGWISSRQGYDRASITLKYLYNRLPQVHGWYYHFVNLHTGAREWNCELSSIDTALLVTGALIAGQEWPNTEVQKLARQIYARVDWQWMLTNGGREPAKKLLSMGWTPEHGFLKGNWDSYCELMELYLLGMGSPVHPLTRASWNAWKRPVYSYKGLKTLQGGPIFLQQMAQEFYNFHDWKDDLGWNYWQCSVAAMKIQRQFCIDHKFQHKGYGENGWGLNASDGPAGYSAYGVPDPEDGTLSPTGAIAALPYTPVAALSDAGAVYHNYSGKLWGRYGFGDSYNPGKNWYDSDVIGIDLGMALIGIEDARTGLIWKLMDSLPSTQKAWREAGFTRISGREEYQLYISPH